MKNKEEKLNISKLAGGAIQEAIDFALDEIFENIKDPNTLPEKSRKLTVTIDLKPDETRQIIKTSIGCKTTLVPVKPITTQLYLDQNGSNVVATELLKHDPNQVDIDEFNADKEDKENKTNKNIINLEREAN